MNIQTEERRKTTLAGMNREEVRQLLEEEREDRDKERL